MFPPFSVFESTTEAIGDAGEVRCVDAGGTMIFSLLQHQTVSNQNMILDVHISSEKVDHKLQS